jgi:hypothetical protein
MGHWDGSEWDSGTTSDYLDLYDASTWASSYRPSKIRITINSSTAQTIVIGLYDTSFSLIASDLGYSASSGSNVITLDITFGSNDLDNLFINGEASYSVTNIEFQ